MNYFQSSFKLMEKSLNGSAVTKRHSPPATPCDRVIGHESASADVKAKLAKQRGPIHPMVLLHTIREAQPALTAIVTSEIRAIPRGESLGQFLARLPDRWRQDEGASSQGAKVKGATHMANSERSLRGRVERCVGLVARRLGRQSSGIAEPVAFGRSGPLRPDTPANPAAQGAAVEGHHGGQGVYAAADTTLSELDLLRELALVGGDPKH